MFSQHAFEGVLRNQFIKMKEEVMCSVADSAIGSITCDEFCENDADDDDKIE